MVYLSDISEFLKYKDIAVLGASRNKKKYGNMLVKRLKEEGYQVYSVNPVAEEIEGLKTYKSVEELPAGVKAAVIATHKENNIDIVNRLSSRGFEYLWFSYRTSDEEIIKLTETYQIKYIDNYCILMFLKSTGFPHNIHRFFLKMFGKYPK